MNPRSELGLLLGIEIPLSWDEEDCTFYLLMARPDPSRFEQHGSLTIWGDMDAMQARSELRSLASREREKRSTGIWMSY